MRFQTEWKVAGTGLEKKKGRHFVCLEFDLFNWLWFVRYGRS